ncbi:hypothetical protein, partial [Rheinheimera gaetbuli]
MDAVRGEKLNQDAKRELLRNKLKKKYTAEKATPKILKVVLQKDEEYPLSFTQQRLWVLDQIDNGSAHYNM